MLLVDTSALILAEHGLIALNDYGHTEVAICPPVVQEILQTAWPERLLAQWLHAFDRMHILDAPVPLERFHEAAHLYRTCRDAGITIRRSTDCLIAATAIAHDAVVLHDDRDFDHLAQVTALRALRA